MLRIYLVGNHLNGPCPEVSALFSAEITVRSSRTRQRLYTSQHVQGLYCPRRVLYCFAHLSLFGQRIAEVAAARLRHIRLGSSPFVPKWEGLRRWVAANHSNIVGTYAIFWWVGGSLIS